MMMKPLSSIGVALMLLCAAVSAQEKDKPETVYGPKTAFNISAPEGWVVDNEAGKEQGMPCVLYPKGSSWSDAKTVMYANTAGPSLGGEKVLVETAHKESK